MPLKMGICGCGCSTLIKAIGKYILKVDEDIASELSDMGYEDTEDSVSGASNLEDELAETLNNQTNVIVEALKSAATLEAAKEIMNEFFENDVTKDTICDIFEEYYNGRIVKLANIYIRETDGELVVNQIRQSTSAWINEWSEKLSDMMQLTSQEQIGNLIKTSIEDGEGVDDLARRLMQDGIRNEEYRARRAALTEMLRAHSVAQQEAMIQSPSVGRKKWRHTGAYRNEPRSNHVDMDGQIVPVNEPFELHGIKGGIYYPMYPRDPLLPPEESINCHCLSQPIVDDDILGMSLEERQELQQKIIDEDDGAWKAELDAANKAKAGINEDTVRLDWIKSKEREGQIRYFGGQSGGGKQRLALIDSGVITTDKELETLYKVNDSGKRVRKTLQELADDGIFTVRNVKIPQKNGTNKVYNPLSHSTIGEYISSSKKYPNGRLSKGGHSQSAMDAMDEKGIKYHVQKTYSNGVRIGYIENHVQKTKAGIISDKHPDADIGQSWFPKDWNEEKVRAAGTYVANKGTGSGNVKFAEYEGVRVGIFVDSNGNPMTIFPDNMKQPNQDGEMEGARD